MKILELTAVDERAGITASTESIPKLTIWPVSHPLLDHLAPPLEVRRPRSKIRFPQHLPSETIEYVGREVLSAMVTEIMSMIFIVICSNLVVAAVAGLLLIVVKYLSSVDDYLLIQEQHKKVALIEKLEDERQAASLAESSEASSALQADLRFFHNSTSPGHVIIKMAHVTFCYVSPVFFFYFVFSCGALPSNHHNYLQTSEIVCSIVLFCLISSLQIKEHGRVIHLINNIFHCEKVIIFDKQFDVFSCLLDSPDSIKEAKQVRWAWSGRL